MTLGHNLLAATPYREPRAVAIRNGGYRLDLGQETMMLPDGAPSRAQIFHNDAVAESTPSKLPSAEDFAEAVRIWAWLIENDRVWNNTLLDRP